MTLLNRGLFQGTLTASSRAKGAVRWLPLILLLAACVQAPEQLPEAPTVGCPAAHVAACDAAMGPCLTACQGRVTFEMLGHCIPRCKREIFSCYARCPVPEGKR
jgi:hypothetical protein